MGQALSFDDLIPQQGATAQAPANLSFHDLIPSSNQPAGNGPAQGESASPSNFGVGNDQQDNPLKSLNEYFTDKPNTYYGSVLPFSRNETTGETSLALPEMIRSPMRGITEMMARAGGQYAPTTDISQGGPMAPLSPDAIQALTMLSPTSVANASNMIRSVPQTQPIGNQLVNYASSKFPDNAMADSEEQSLNQVLASNGQQTAKPQGSALMQGFVARDGDALSSASDANFAASSGLYKQMRDAGAVLNQSAAGDLSSNIDDALKQNLFIPQLNPKTLGIVDHIKAAIDANGSMPLDQLDQYRRLLSRVGSSEDGVSAGSVKKAIDSTVNGLDQTDLQNGSPQAVDLLNQARASYAASSRFDDVAEVIQKANGDPNRLKAGLTKFAANDQNTIGWPQEAKDALQNAADTGIGENLLKALGKFGIDFSKSGTGNTVLPVLASMGKVGGASLVPGGMPMVAAATVARQAQKYLARGKAEQLLNTLQNGVQQ